MRWRSEDAYSLKEAEYPILTGLSHSLPNKVLKPRSTERDWWNGLRRFDVSLSIEDVKMNREELKQQLVQFSREANQSAQSGYEAARNKVETLFGDAGAETTAAVASNDESLDTLIKWLDESFSHQIERSIANESPRAVTRSRRRGGRSLLPRNAANGTAGSSSNR